jgi:hypothetical protein
MRLLCTYIHFYTDGGAVYRLAYYHVNKTRLLFQNSNRRWLSTFCVGWINFEFLEKNVYA